MCEKVKVRSGCLLHSYSYKTRLLLHCSKTIFRLVFSVRVFVISFNKRVFLLLFVIYLAMCNPDWIVRVEIEKSETYLSFSSHASLVHDSSDRRVQRARVLNDLLL